MKHAWEAIINAYTILVGEREDKICLGNCRRRFEDNIKMDLLEIEWTGITL
jgi:hypothetical protein